MARSDSSPSSKTAYHHGDLRAALLETAEGCLNEFGIEGFSLRKVAKAAGVSHAAPAHHFKDTAGLLTALAELGFQRFHEHLLQAESRAAADPLSRLVAAGVGYIEFAERHPALFRLMFSSDRPDHGDAELQSAATQAYGALIDRVTALTGEESDRSPETQLAVSAAWALAHGLADLLIAGRMKSLLALDKPDRQRALDTLFRRQFGHLADDT